MAEDQNSGPLSPERNESIFRNDILPDYLPTTVAPAERPRLIVLGGQPGAGKTGVLIASHSELEQSGSAIRIVGDDLRSYHPQFLSFQRQDQETASQFTQVDAGRWTEKLLAAATERKVNIVFETTMRTPENVARIIGIAREAGYEVEVRAVAVNPRLSWQGNHYRFEEMLRLGDAARIPPQYIHDAAVDGLRISLEKIETERLADRVQLRTRGGAILYDNEMRQGEWSRPPGARQALEAEQSRPMSRSDLHRFADDWSYLLSRMEERKAPADRIAEVKTRAADDVSYLLTRRREADGEDARRQRTIFRRQADALGLFVELYDNALRDHERRPIGNVEAHATGRLEQTYAALKLIEATRDLGLLPEGARIVVTRAMVQDKRGSHEFPAAHRLPADLAVETRDGSRRRLSEHLDVALNCVAVDREIFSRTDRLSRLVNVVDSWLEAAGMRKTLADAANAVAIGGRSVEAAMAEIIEPGYRGAVTRARDRLERNLAIAERAAIATTIVNVSGEPFRAVRDDLRLRAGDLENRARAKAMMDAVLTETARHLQLDPVRQRAADELIRGITDNERKLDRRRALDRNTVQFDALIPARQLPDLSELQIANRLHASSRLADKRAEIESLSRLVFGNSQAAAGFVERITGTRSGEAMGEDVRTGRLAELAGEGRKWLRGPSPERRTAEANAPRLAAALADYGLAVDFERHRIVSEHREEQVRQRVEIPRMSPALTGVLGAERHEQVRRFNAEPALRRELDNIAAAINKRLSPAEKTDLRDGNTARLASSLGVTTAQGAALRDLHQRVRATQDRALHQSRDFARGSRLDLRR